MLELKILKIGGSIITEKRKDVFEKANEDAIEELCEAIARKPENLILIHGAGSFGHPYVEKFRLREEKNVYGVSLTHLACSRLNGLICQTLSKFGVSPLPIHPITFFKKIGSLQCDLDFILKAVDEGFLPVIHGDMIFCDGKFEVLSGDDIAIHLAEKLSIDRLGFATDVEGILIDGKLVKKLDYSLIEKIGEAEGKSDVTGGMKGKVNKIFSMKKRCEVYIFKGDKESVARFLNGEVVGTQVIL